MRLFFASDIHGSAAFCKKMLDCYKAEGAARLILLGDILYHGPRNDLPAEYNPRAVIELLSEYKEEILCVRGNCDSEVDQMVLPFPILAEYALLCADGRQIYLTHGHHLNEELPLMSGNILIHGHTHIPRSDDECGILYLNPGSVSIPKEGSPHSYMVYENNTFEWKDLDKKVYKKLNI